MGSYWPAVLGSVEMFPGCQWEQATGRVFLMKVHRMWRSFPLSLRSARAGVLNPGPWAKPIPCRSLWGPEIWWWGHSTSSCPVGSLRGWITCWIHGQKWFWSYLGTLGPAGGLQSFILGLREMELVFMKQWSWLTWLYLACRLALAQASKR